MEKTMENEMETEIIYGIKGVIMFFSNSLYWGPI